MNLTLVKETDPILQQPTQDWDFNNPPCDAVELAHAMYELMDKSAGIGLAAPQVGLPYRMFVMRSIPKLAIFNPKIVWTSDKEVEMEEGCLSFPGLGIRVFRPESIRTRFTSPNGITETKLFNGLTARVFQHEYDHLNGVCFTSKVSKLKLDMYERKRKKLAKQIERGQVTLQSDLDFFNPDTSNPKPYDPQSTAGW